MDIHSWITSKAIKCNSSISGIGLFAKEHIIKGEIVAIKRGTVIHKNDLNLSSLHDYSVQLNKNYILCTLKECDLEKEAVYLNHSCDANVGVGYSLDEVIFVAMRNINVGEELTIDYGMIWCDEYQMECKCDKKNCRKIITGDDWKSKTFQNKYEKYCINYNE